MPAADSDTTAIEQLNSLNALTDPQWWSHIEWFSLAEKLGIWIAIVLCAWILGGIVSHAIRRKFDATDTPSRTLLKAFMVLWSRRIIVLLGVVIAFGNVGIDIAPLIAGLGVLGFVIGFALQGTLSNFASGVMLLIYQPFDEGDLIETNGITGSVSGLSIVSTTLLTPDGREVIIPNSSIWGSTIINMTRNKTRRIDLVIGVSYDADLKQTKELIQQHLASMELVLSDPAPTVEVAELADSSVNLVVRPWVNTADYWTVHFQALHELKDLLDQNDIEIPFPQRVVHSK